MRNTEGKEMLNIYLGVVFGNRSRPQLHDVTSVGEIDDASTVFLNYSYYHCLPLST